MHIAVAEREPRLPGRQGFVLAFVLVTTALVAVLSLAAVSLAWRSYRATRLAANAVRAQFAAEEGIAIRLDAWSAESLAAMALGRTQATRVTSAIGDTLRIRVTRTQPLVAWLSAELALGPMGTPRIVRRTIMRALTLEPPALPVIGAVTALADVHAQSPTIIDGRDVADAADACGLLRDTLSLVPLAATGLIESPPGSWIGQPMLRRITDTTTLRVEFERAWNTVTSRSPARMTGGSPVSLEPLPGWHTLLLSGPVVSVRPLSHWRGLLAVNGDLLVTGSLDVDGVLVVRGRLDARGADLRVRGALIVASVGGSSVALGDRTQIRYNRCAVQMALATIAQPSSRPFALWFSPTF